MENIIFYEDYRDVRDAFDNLVDEIYSANMGGIGGGTIGGGTIVIKPTDPNGGYTEYDPSTPGIGGATEYYPTTPGIGGSYAEGGFTYTEGEYSYTVNGSDEYYYVAYAA